MKPATNSDQLHGTLDMLVLKILHNGSLHGYAIALRLEQTFQRGPQRRRRLALSGVYAWSVAAAASAWGSPKPPAAPVSTTLPMSAAQQFDAETASSQRLTTAVAHVLNG